MIIMWNFFCLKIFQRFILGKIYLIIKKVIKINGAIMKRTNLLPSKSIESKILFIRGLRVMIDSDLAKLFGVSTKALNQAVKRNVERFPNDFMIMLTREEKDEVVTNCDHLRNLKYSSSLPYAFTEYGAIMLASVLNSAVAVEASIYVVRAFVRQREILLSYKELATKLKEIELKVNEHDEDIRNIIEALNQLLIPPEKPKRQIGFQIKEPIVKYSSKKKK